MNWVSGDSDDVDEQQISNEDIRHLVFREEPKEVKFPMYRSKFSERVREEYFSGRNCHQTMGLADGKARVSPDEFLKKRTRRLFRANVAPKKEEKPPAPTSKVPTKEEWAKLAPRVEQNFLLNNIRNAVRSVPKTGPSRAFDTAQGKRVHNCNLLIPTFQWSDKFGKVPSYIGRMKQQLEEQGNQQNKKKELSSATVGSTASGAKEPSTAIEKRVKVISPEEREELLQNLKDVWASLQREFQLLPFLNDTQPKIKRKEALEKRLTELERDIKTVEENERIYVIEDPKDARCLRHLQPDPCYEH